METARVRKAFKYPDDEDINVGESAAGLDEQEQEKVIEDLKDWDHRSTQFWKTFLTATVAIIAIYYMLIMFGLFSSQDASGVYVALCSICTASSALLIYGLPETVKTLFPFTKTEVDSEYLPQFVRNWKVLWFDAVLVISNTLFELIVIANSDFRTATPALVAFFIAVMARQTLQPINVADLERLKYVYKGA